MKNPEKKDDRTVSQGEPGNEYTKQQSRTGSGDKGYEINKSGSKSDDRSNLKKERVNNNNDDTEEMDDDRS